MDVLVRIMGVLENSRRIFACPCKVDNVAAHISIFVFHSFSIYSPLLKSPSGTPLPKSHFWRSLGSTARFFLWVFLIFLVRHLLVFYWNLVYNLFIKLIDP